MAKTDWDNVYKDLEDKWRKDSSVVDDKTRMKDVNKQLEKNAKAFDKYGKNVKDKEERYPTISQKDSYTKIVSGIVGAKAIQDLSIHDKVGTLPVGNNVKDSVKTCDLVNAKVTDKKK